MTYTLDMASDLEPRIAEDGVQEVPLTKARALLTRVIEEAREDGLISALTIRDRRRIYLVTPAYYEQAEKDRAVATAVQKVLRDLPPDQRTDFSERLAEHLMDVD